MQMNMLTAAVRYRGFDAAEALQAAVIGSQAQHDQAQDLAGFAEYLSLELHGLPERAAATASALREWSDWDPAVLAQARTTARADANLEHVRNEALALLRSAPTVPP